MVPNLQGESGNYQCCCCHVEKAAFVIAFLGGLFSVVNAVCYLIAGYKLQGVLAGINLFLYLSILYAQEKRNPKYYWPFLALNGIVVVVLAICSIILVISALFFRPVDDVGKSMRFVLIIYSVVITIYTVVTALFWHLVYRAYRYMVENH